MVDTLKIKDLTTKLATSSTELNELQKNTKSIGSISKLSNINANLYEQLSQLKFDNRNLERKVQELENKTVMLGVLQSENQKLEREFKKTDH